MIKAIKRIVLSGLVALTMALSLEAVAGDALQRVIDFQVLKVGMSGNQPPMTMVNREGGLMGFDVDVATALAMAMNVKLEIKQMPFGDLLQALEDYKIDLILSNMSITPERTEKVSFVGPYMMSGMSILTKDSALKTITSVDDFNKKGLRLLALKNSTHANFVKTVAPDATLTETGSYDEGVAMLIDGKADALVADMTQCILAVMRYPDAGLKTLDKPLTVEPIGIAISKNDAQFFNLVDNYLRAYEKTGVLTQLRKKWFEDDAWIAALP
ncbi:MAG TPA: transporter substrate-binding domain-containing protein [Methylophilaceae bacterium]|nr:transporter substrate-binding domain-containing protein [Methylophilaceae bacterium]